ncbi:MAG: C10 family peptidase [Bacteroidales bacterium]|nr:C10 family peptidase [Bacteroidales bacterium]
MKKLRLLVLLLFASLSASAGVVPMTRAKAEAERFLKDVAPAHSPQLQLMFESPRMTKAGLTEPEYFIFEDARGGYVIAAGDDAVPPVLGYSTSEFFRTEEMPENLRAWLDMWTDIVDDARLRNAAPYTATTKPTGRAKLLKTALWGQGKPYNNHCLEINGKKCVTGCSNTATAILMRYHKWPSEGRGRLPAYSFESMDGDCYSHPAVSLGHTYDWDNMPLTSGARVRWTPAQQEEVAILMRDVGVMLQSDYSPDGTGAWTDYVVPGMVKYMDYDAGAFFDEKDYYSDLNDWVNLLIKNIDEVGPVLYSADSASGGHSFLLDGYDENNYFHVNWGWDGEYNGYFIMPELGGYTNYHRAILGLQKNAGGEAPAILRLFSAGLLASAEEFSVGEPFSLSCQSLANFGPGSFSGEVAFAKLNRFDCVDELISRTIAVSLASNVALLKPNEVLWNPEIFVNYANVPCMIRTPIKPGDHIQMVYRSSSIPTWTPVSYDHEDDGVSGSFSLYDVVPLETITSLAYNPATGILTVSFSDEASCELRRGSSVIRDGVSETGREVQIDANQLVPSSYTLRLQYGGQVKDIAIKFGLKK